MLLTPTTTVALPGRNPEIAAVDDVFAPAPFTIEIRMPLAGAATVELVAVDEPDDDDDEPETEEDDAVEAEEEDEEEEEPEITTTVPFIHEW